MKTSSLVLLFTLLFLNANAFAQKNEEKKPKGLVNVLLSNIIDYVHITEDQRKAIVDYAVEYEKLMKSTSHNKSIVNKQPFIDSALHVFRSRVNEILTIEQQDSILIGRIRTLQEQMSEYK